MSQQVLYRKFRPQTFAEVVNQEAIKTTLKNAVAAGAVAHAYLFTGPRGVGKTSLARILAKAVNCLDNSSQPPLYKSGGAGQVGSPSLSKRGGGGVGEPCDKCANCQAVREGRFLDLIEIDAASHTGVDNIREVIEQVRFSPSVGKFKVIVIDEVHMLSKGAFGALLKTLEEPPAHAMFVLATTEINKVPATIVSRTQRFDFKRLAQSAIVEQLARVAHEVDSKIPREILKLIARAADGGMRDALSLLDRLLAFGLRDLTLERAEEILGLSSLGQQQAFLSHLAHKRMPEAYALLKAMSEKGGDASQFANGFLEYLDMVLGFSLNPGDGRDFGLVPEDLEILKHHAQIPRAALVELTQLFLSAAGKIKISPLPELPLVIAAVQFIDEAESNDARGGGFQTAAETRPVQSSPMEKPVSKSAAQPAATGAVDDFLPEITRRWNNFLSQLKSYNHSLISSFKLATLVESDGRVLLVAFPYRFHQDSVEQRKNKVVVEKALEEVYGRAIKLKTCMLHEIDEYKTKTADRKNSLMDEALKVFRIEDAS